MKQIKTIVIIGGGTAGWTAAHVLMARTTPDVKIKLIASKEIKTIGVGEGTTGLFPDIIKFLGQATNLNEDEFLFECDATLKYGLKYTDWAEKGDVFYSPIGDDFPNEIKYPHADYDYMRMYHVAINEKYENAFQTTLMKENKLAFHKDTLEDFFKNINQPVAYHLDTYKTAEYLKTKAIAVKGRFEYIEDTLTNVNKDEDDFIKSVLTKSGKEIEGDLFVDCSGFAKVLIEKEYENKFIPFDGLINNRALAFQVPNKKDEKIRNYTHAWAQKHGWIWEIPTQTRYGCGYVFNDEISKPEVIEEEIKSIYGNVEIQKDIKFKAGRNEKFWIKNVICSGLSAGFVEPLQATSIHNSIVLLNHFMENYYHKHMPFECQHLQDQYNKEMTELWNSTRDLIRVHYQTKRTDSEYWIQARKEETLSKTLKRNLDVWSVRMPRVVDYVNDKSNNFFYFGNNLWIQILMGMQLLEPKVAKQELIDYYLLEHSKQHLDFIKKEVPFKVKQCVTTNDYYSKI